MLACATLGPTVQGQQLCTAQLRQLKPPPVRRYRSTVLSECLLGEGYGRFCVSHHFHHSSVGEVWACTCLHSWYQYTAKFAAAVPHICEATSCVCGWVGCSTPGVWVCGKAVVNVCVALEPTADAVDLGLVGADLLAYLLADLLTPALVHFFTCQLP